MKTIAVVDDEKHIRENLLYALEKEGYRVECYSHGEEAWEGLSRSMADLLVLDVMMPRMDGLELCRKIRSVDEEVPIIFLSSRSDEIDRILGLEMGGDDYVCKPFSLKELMVRIKILLRRTDPDRRSATATRILRCGDLSLDVEGCRLWQNEEEVELTVTEFRMLESLITYPGVVKSREQLMRAAFPADNYVSDRAADSHIKRLRKKLSLKTPYTAIETVYGLGYRFKES
ncbi:MAG: response regulator transcription factor [Spirochaetales bacterium]|nr:response regulator transcription factor [Spirochaetales bacterium]